MVWNSGKGSTTGSTWAREGEAAAWIRADPQTGTGQAGTAGSSQFNKLQFAVAPNGDTV
jgi:hypothetical protein